MLQTKVEVKMRKAEAGSWYILNIPSTKDKDEDEEEQGKVSTSAAANVQNLANDDVDLSDL